jgi:hypothetical protein
VLDQDGEGQLLFWHDSDGAGCHGCDRCNATRAALHFPSNVPATDYRFVLASDLDAYERYLLSNKELIANLEVQHAVWIKIGAPFHDGRRLHRQHDGCIPFFEMLVNVRCARVHQPLEVLISWALQDQVPMTLPTRLACY